MIELNLSWWQDLPPCSSCKVFLPRDGFRTCQRCTDRWRDDRAQKKREGRCYACGKPSTDGVYCPDCLGRRKANQPEPSDDICSGCQKNAPRPGKKTCQGCADRSKKINDAFRKKKICRKCRSPLSKYDRQRARGKFHLYCHVCREASRSYFADRREKLQVEGKCWRHPDRPTAPNDRQRCEQCVEDHAAYSKARYDALRAAGKCVWCAKADAVEGSVYCAIHKEEAARTDLRSRKRRELDRTQVEGHDNDVDVTELSEEESTDE